MTCGLPDGFESLEPFVARWARDSFAERLHARCESDMDEIRAFYDAMLPLAPAAIARIDREPLASLSETTAVLARLVLALAQAAIAVEMHGAPRAPGTPYPNQLRVETALFPFG
jgi:hypothetical protein